MRKLGSFYWVYLKRIWVGLLQSPWIPKKWPKHLLIFSSAQNNHIVGRMMKKKKVKKLTKKNLNWIWNFVISEKSAEAEKILSSPNFFILLTTISPIKRFLADSILLEGTLPCERGSFWHPASFWQYSGTEFRAVFVRRLFQKNLIFLLLWSG